MKSEAPKLRVLPPPSEDGEGEFVALLTAHQGGLRAYIVSLMPGDSNVNDVLQEANLTLWKKRDLFQAGSNFTAWSFAVARYAVKELRARQTRDQRRLVFSDALLEIISLTPDEADPAAIEARHLALGRCREKLGEADRAILDARYAADDSIEQHSQRTGRSAGSLRVSLIRIRAALRKCIRLELESSR